MAERDVRDMDSTPITVITPAEATGMLVGPPQRRRPDLPMDPLRALPVIEALFDLANRAGHKDLTYLLGMAVQETQRLAAPSAH